MSLTWGAFREQIRRSVLRDLDDAVWTNDQLKDACGWALDTFCAHTAVATAIVHTDVDTTLPLPENLYGDLERSGLLYVRYNESVGTYFPALTLPANSVEASFSVWGDLIYLSSAPPAGSELTILYYA